MKTKAMGSFDVKMTPQAVDNGSQLGVMDLEKTFYGDLEASSRGYMLAAQTAVSGSAGYVAIERVSGVLNGRKGTFVIQHTGVMDKGAPSLTIAVVPDSATDQLEGLTGHMVIIVEDGNHAYEFDYELKT